MPRVTPSRSACVIDREACRRNLDKVDKDWTRLHRHALKTITGLGRGTAWCRSVGIRGPGTGNNYFAPPPHNGAKYCDECFCVAVCLSIRSRIAQKQYVRTSRNSLYTLPVGVARFFSSDNAICCVFPVLWLTSCLPIMGRIAIAHFRRSLISFARGCQQCTHSLLTECGLL